MEVSHLFKKFKQVKVCTIENLIILLYNGMLYLTATAYVQ